jgi:hypothetical protein
MARETYQQSGKKIEWKFTFACGKTREKVFFIRIISIHE